ncbi:MAG: hypothetical protein ACFFAO_11880 [Candidatus Hermodarchaeota archaeon]
MGNLKCSICNHRFKKNSNIFISNEKPAHICEKCYFQFSKDEIDHFLSIFREFGGFFGELKKEGLSLESILKEFLEKHTYELGNNFFEESLKLRHKALLYGYKPQQVISKLKDIL